MSKQQHQYKEFKSENEEQHQDDPLSNLISLQLHKPGHWKWELSSSRSCNNIALPRILLYDHTGRLLLDSDGQSEQTYRSKTEPDRSRKRAATDNLEPSLQQVRLTGEFHGLHIGEEILSDTPECSPVRQQLAGSCIDLSTHKLPDWQPHEHSGMSRRSSSLRGVRFEDRLHQRSQELAYPTPPSTSTLTANSSSSGPREKRRYRRSHSSCQRSILERLSMSRGRHSSPEFFQEQLLERTPRYFLRSSKAGTLVIQEESFSRVRQRRHRHRHSSNENMLVPHKSPADSVVQDTEHSHNQQQHDRAALLSTSEEESQPQGRSQLTRQSHCRRNQRNCGKALAEQEITKVAAGNSVFRTETFPTAH